MTKKIIGLLIVLTTAFFVKPVNAQVSVQVNIGDQPEWGPAGYDHAVYYYLPDIETYYYVPRRQFVYLSGGRWVFAASLPPRYAHYDLYSGYKVVLSDRYAYRGFRDHRVRYAGYRNRPGQQVIVVNKHDNGKHKGHYKGRGHNKHRD